MSFHLKITCTSCTDDARVKVPSFQKVTFFYNIKYFTETLSICIFFKDVSDCPDLRRQASNALLQSDSSFLLRNSMKTNTTGS